MNTSLLVIPQWKPLSSSYTPITIFIAQETSSCLGVRIVTRYKVLRSRFYLVCEIKLIVLLLFINTNNGFIGYLKIIGMQDSYTPEHLYDILVITCALVLAL